MFRVAKVSINLLVFLLVSLGGNGCTGKFIEKTTLDPAIIGKVIHFKNPMAYLIFNEVTARKYGFSFVRFDDQVIRRELDNRFSAQELRQYVPNLRIQFIDKNMSFVILGSYWERGRWLTREFAPDIQFIVLKDENNILSSYMIAGDEIQDTLMSYTDYVGHWHGER